MLNNFHLLIYTAMLDTLYRNEELFFKTSQQQVLLEFVFIADMSKRQKRILMMTIMELPPCVASDVVRVSGESEGAESDQEELPAEIEETVHW